MWTDGLILVRCLRKGPKPVKKETIFLATNLGSAKSSLLIVYDGSVMNNFVC